MDFDSFSRAAHEAFQSIPEEFREGVDGLTVRSEALPDPIYPTVFILGQCLTEGYPSDWVGPDTLRSVVVLYHGSFKALARLDPEFDWEGELWETLTHELRHHLEHLADEDDLIGVDYAMAEAFKREDGEVFDPFYYRSGIEVASGIYQVEYDFFIEEEWDAAAFESADFIDFSWHGNRYRVSRPEVLGDLHYVWIHGIEIGPGNLQLVLIRKRSWMKRLTSGGASDLELFESVREIER